MYWTNIHVQILQSSQTLFTSGKLIWFICAITVSLCYLMLFQVFPVSIAAWLLACFILRADDAVPDPQGNITKNNVLCGTCMVGSCGGAEPSYRGWFILLPCPAAGHPPAFQASSLPLLSFPYKALIHEKHCSQISNIIWFVPFLELTPCSCWCMSYFLGDTRKRRLKSYHLQLYEFIYYINKAIGKAKMRNSEI